jgi:hypothetical protein
MDRITNEKHTDEHNMPLEDIDAIAKEEGTTRAKILQEIASGARSPELASAAQGEPSVGQGASQQGGFSQEYNSDQFQSSPSNRQDGYNETQGTGYGQTQNTAGQPVDATQAQNDYDPTHSGVRHAQNQPGTRPPAPGRETGTSWGEDQQMGATTDTPDRKNPAG